MISRRTRREQRNMETEVKAVRKREWVKNAAIVFLAILLLLTFFSNTILNHSLPEVATRAIGSGTIAARIRVSGTVSANKNYEVSIEESRKVHSVMVRQGQEINAGDVLFVLAEGDGEELEQAKDRLRELQKSYQQKVISASDADYAKEDLSIRHLREDIRDKQAERDAMVFDPAPLEQAQARLEAELLRVAEAEAEIQPLKDAVEQAKQGVEDAKFWVDEARRVVETRKLDVEAEQENVNRAKSNVRNAQEPIDRYTRELEKAQYGRDNSKNSSGTHGSASHSVTEDYEAAQKAYNEAASTLSAIEKEPDYHGFLEYSRANASGDPVLASEKLSNSISQYEGEPSVYYGYVSTLSTLRSDFNDIIHTIEQYNVRIEQTDSTSDWELLYRLKTDKAQAESSRVQKLVEIRKAAEELVITSNYTLAEAQALLEAIPAKPLGSNSIQDNNILTLMQALIDAISGTKQYPEEYYRYTKYLNAYTSHAAAAEMLDDAREALALARDLYETAMNGGNYVPAESYAGHSHDYWVQEYNRINDLLRDAQADKARAERAQAEAQAKVEEAESRLSAAQEKVVSAQEKVTAAQEKVSEAEAKVTEASGGVTEAKARQAEAEAALREQEDKKTQFESKCDETDEQIKTLTRSLEDQLVALRTQQASDDKQSRLDALDISDLAVQVDNQRKKVDELAASATDTEVRAQVSGVIQSIAITAGQTTTPKTAMAVIELPDMGYTLTATVPNDQARRLHTGDTATVANMYWGTQIDAELVSIKADPKDPQNSKTLSFSLSGDVTPGSTLTLSVGQRSAEYDFVIPSSALRSDSNGDFIYIVSARSSPLGDRYTTMRVNVTKVASDDSSTAVTGALNAGDFVITTSTAPLKNGQRVRLADNQN